MQYQMHYIRDMEITTETTCYGPPHCIHFYVGDKEIGGLRYRWGHFQFWPVRDGEDLDNIIECSISKELGILPYGSEDSIIDYCKDILEMWMDGRELPEDRNEYIKNLLDD